MTDATWLLRLGVGLALAALGIVLLANPRAAATTLAVLVGLALVVHGIDELLDRTRRNALGLVAGVASIAGGIVAIAWPDATLWVLAVIAGITCIAVGSLKITTAFMARPEPGWAWLLAIGVASAVVGVLALCWPGATALVLALLLGLRTLGLGVTEIVVAVEGHRAASLA